MNEPGKLECTPLEVCIAGAVGIRQEGWGPQQIGMKQTLRTQLQGMYSGWPQERHDDKHEAVTQGFQSAAELARSR